MKNKVLRLKDEEETVSLNHPYIRKVIEKLSWLSDKLDTEGRVDDELEEIINDLSTAIDE